MEPAISSGTESVKVPRLMRCQLRRGVQEDRGSSVELDDSSGISPVVSNAGWISSADGSVGIAGALE